MTADEFKTFQKLRNAQPMGRRRGKRSVYGCTCCLRESIPQHRKTTRRAARTALKRADRRLFDESF